jgi:uncharacterized membrane protein (UPF0127 family)
VADEGAERHEGLRRIDALPDGVDGMVFVYGAPAVASYGMFETQIPLDIWWFSPEGVLLGSDTMEPCPAEPCLSYASPGPIRWALETPAGEWEFSIGDPISAVESS